MWPFRRNKKTEAPRLNPNPYKRMAKATLEHRTLPNSLQKDFKKGIPGLALLTDISVQESSIVSCIAKIRLQS